MLSRTLSEVRKQMHPSLVKWIKKEFIEDLYPWAIQAVELKEDYDRASFVRLGFQSFNGDWKKAIDAMAALELLDSSLLIVDDIIDDAPRRMGKETIHKAWGLKNAIMLANLLKGTSILALVHSTQENHLTSRELSALLNFVETTYNDMYIGEYIDLRFESLPFEDVSIDDYLDMIKRTTGFHFGMAIKIGGMLAKATQNYLEVLYEIGVRAGMILQIRDDFIDYLDMEHITHKPAFGDFHRKKKRLPLILVYQFFPEKVRQIQNAPFNNSKKKELQSLISHPKIKFKCHEIIKKVYSNTDYLVGKIKSRFVCKALLDFFDLIRSV